MYKKEKIFFTIKLLEVVSVRQETRSIVRYVKKTSKQIVSYVKETASISSGSRRIGAASSSGFLCPPNVGFFVACPSIGHTFPARFSQPNVPLRWSDGVVLAAHVHTFMNRV
jgi:hypothetical protein